MTNHIAGIDADAGDPGAEVARLPKTIPLFPGLEGCILQRILTGVVIAQDRKGYAVEHAALLRQLLQEEIFIHRLISLIGLLPDRSVTLHPLGGG